MFFHLSSSRLLSKPWKLAQSAICKRPGSEFDGEKVSIIVLKMSKVQMLKLFINERLTAAVEEIFVKFLTTIADYEKELSRSREENERQRKLLEALFNSRRQLHRAGLFIN